MATSPERMASGGVRLAHHEGGAGAEAGLDEHGGTIRNPGAAGQHGRRWARVPEVAPPPSESVDERGSRWANRDASASLLVEAPVVERVLAAALRRGGEFAEVFAEDRRGTSRRARRRARRGAVLGRDRGAGVRVVLGDTHRLRPHRRPLRSGIAGGGRGRRRHRPGGAGARRWPLAAPGDGAAQRRRRVPRGRPQGQEDRVAGARRRRRPPAPAGPSPRCPRATATAAVGSRWPTATASS